MTTNKVKLVNDHQSKNDQIRFSKNNDDSRDNAEKGRNKTKFFCTWMNHSKKNIYSSTVAHFYIYLI